MESDGRPLSMRSYTQESNSSSRRLDQHTRSLGVIILPKSVRTSHSSGPGGVVTFVAYHRAWLCIVYTVCRAKLTSHAGRLEGGGGAGGSWARKKNINEVGTHWPSLRWLLALVFCVFCLSGGRVIRGKLSGTSWVRFMLEIPGVSS
jgi:hypothetical protein